MADGKSTITITGDASGLKTASQDAVQSLESVEAAAKKTDAAAGSGGVGGGNAEAVTKLSGSLKEVPAAAANAGKALSDVANSAGAVTGKFAVLGNGVKNLLGAVGLGGVAEAGGKAIKVLQGVTAATGPLGPALALLGAGLYFVKTKFDENAAAARALEDAYKGAAKAATDLADKTLDAGGSFDIDKKLEDLETLQQAEIEALAIKLKNEKWTAESIAKAIETKRAENAQKLADFDAALLKKSEDAEKAASSDRYDRAISDNKALQNAIALEGLTGVEKIKAEEGIAISELAAKRIKENDLVIQAELESGIEATKTLYALRAELAQKAIDEENKKKEEQIKKDADTRMKAEMEADRKIHEERKRQLDELRDSASGDLGGIQYFNSGRDAIWMSGGGGR